MAAITGSVTRRLRRSTSLLGDRSKSTGDCSMRLIMVPSEKPASTSWITESFVSVGVFSSFTGADPSSTGGRMMRTVAEPVVCDSPVLAPFMPRPFIRLLDDPPEPNIETPSSGELEPLDLALGPSSKNTSSPSSSALDMSMPASPSIARMTCSLTLLRFSSISRSAVSSNLLGRERMIAMRVFSLKPAWTNLITAALVSGSEFCCAITELRLAKTQKVRSRRALNISKILVEKILTFRRCSPPLVMGFRLLGTAVITIAYFSHIVSRFPVGWHPVSEPHDGPFPGVVARQHQVHTAIELIHQLLQIASAAGDVLRRIERVANPEARCCSRHQLHQATRTFGRKGASTEVRFLLHDAEDQIRVYTVFCAILLNKRINPGVSSCPRPFFPRVRFGHGFQVDTFNLLDTAALDENIQGAPLMPNSSGRLIYRVHFHLGSANQMDPDFFGFRGGLRNSLVDWLRFWFWF